VKNEVTEAIGIRYVQQIVREEWLCRWQELEARNDDAIDGLIFYKKKGKVTDTIYTQVKSGKGYKVISGNFPNHICINLGKTYIEKHKQRWLSYPGPVILIYVDTSIPKKPIGWWADLKNVKSYTDSATSYILVPNEQLFDIRAKKPIFRLTAHRHQESILPNINVDNKILSNITLSQKSLKETGFEYYKKLSGENLTPACKEFVSGVRFTRIGWRHITRKTRSLTRIVQSLLILPVAKKILEEVDTYQIVDYFNEEDEEKNIIHYQTLLLRARVSFSYRYPAIINLILRRKIKVNPDNNEPIESSVWFYSIYESRRGRDLVR
jgi:hypothetical protein